MKVERKETPALLPHLLHPFSQKQSKPTPNSWQLLHKPYNTCIHITTITTVMEHTITGRSPPLWLPRMAEPSMRTSSNVQLLQELEVLSQSLAETQNRRRAFSLALPRSSAQSADPIPSSSVLSYPADDAQTSHRTRSSRMSMSSWRFRRKQQPTEADDRRRASTLAGPTVDEKKGIRSWKLIRALSHVRMQRLRCLFSVEVVAVHGLPATLNGLRLSIAVRKKLTKDGAMQTLPSRVLQRSAHFDETLFIQCHVYCSGGAGTSKPLKFEPCPFIISTVAIDDPELDFGKNIVDLSQLVRESIERSLEGARIRQWDATLELSGKAKGAELVVKLGFQIMEDTGVRIYSQLEALRSSNNKGKNFSSSVARKQSKSSFSVISPSKRMEPSQIPLEDASAEGLDDFNLDEVGPPPLNLPTIKKSEPEWKVEELDVPEFEVIDKGIEVEGAGGEEEEVQSEEAAAESSASSKLVKEVLHNRARLMELDSIAMHIAALESMMTGDEISSMKTAQERESQGLDANEKMVVREFLQMLELKANKQHSNNKLDLISPLKRGAGEGSNGEGKAFISDLGKGLGSVVQTKDGGFLASINPFNLEVPRNETPKLAMQISRSFILRDLKMATGFEVLQRLAAIGSAELSSKLLSLTAMDELMGKTAEQIAFEGIASAIISGRNKEGASSSAARSIAMVRTMATALGEGRRERITTGIWNVREDPMDIEEILAYSLQKIEVMAVKALKIQAGMADEEAPFDLSPLTKREDLNKPLDSAISIEDWAKTSGSDDTVTLLVVIQLRDPLRRYEEVGAPAIAVVQANRVENNEQESMRFKVTSLNLGGLKLRSGATRSAWDGEKQRMTAMQWLVAYGLRKAGKKREPLVVEGGHDLLWSLSSRVMADMWLESMRNPDVKAS